MEKLIKKIPENFMNRFLRCTYRQILLDAMDDPQAPPVGTKGTVEFVDDAGMIHMHWETGSFLGLAPGEESFHKM